MLCLSVCGQPAMWAQETDVDLPLLTRWQRVEREKTLAEAQRAMEAQQWDEADRLLTVLLRRVPEDWPARLKRARLRGWQRAWARAEVDASWLLAHRPNDPESWRVFGDLAFWRNDLERAQRAYERCLALDPDGPAVEMLVQVAAARTNQQVAEAWQLVEQGEVVEGERALDRILQKTPDHLAARIMRARLRGWDRRWADAQADVTRALALSPEHAPAWQLAGDLAMWQQDWDRAEAAYLRFQQLLPEGADAPKEALARVVVLREQAASAQVALPQGDVPDVALDRVRAAREALQHTLQDKVDPVIVSVVGAPTRRAAQRAMGWQPPCGGGAWEAGVRHAWQVFDGVREDWHTTTVSLSHRARDHNWSVRHIETTRFGLQDRASELDLYQNLTPDVVLHGRLQVAHEAVVLPVMDSTLGGLVSLPQGLGGAWETEAEWRRMQFAHDTVDIFRGAVGHYRGAWWFQGSVSWTPDVNGLSTAWRARHYFGDCTWLEGAVGYGQGQVELGPQRVVRATSSWVGVRGEHFVARGLAIEGGVTRALESASEASWTWHAGVRWAW